MCTPGTWFVSSTFVNTLHKDDKKDDNDDDGDDDNNNIPSIKQTMGYWKINMCL
jgi:hypothetical protein